MAQGAAPPNPNPNRYPDPNPNPNRYPNPNPNPIPNPNPNPNRNPNRNKALLHLGFSKPAINKLVEAAISRF